MERREFEKVIRRVFFALPERFRRLVKNVAFVVEDKPSAELCEEEGLTAGETLLGFYRGIPYSERGVDYGIGATLPDTITLFQQPIEEAAREKEKSIEEVIFETLWHEIAHYFGMDEEEVRAREYIRNTQKKCKG